MNEYYASTQATFPHPRAENAFPFTILNPGDVYEGRICLYTMSKATQRLFMLSHNTATETQSVCPSYQAPGHITHLTPTAIGICTISGEIEVPHNYRIDPAALPDPHVINSCDLSCPSNNWTTRILQFNEGIVCNN